MSVLYEHRFEEIPNLVLFGYVFRGPRAEADSKRVYDAAWRAVDEIKHGSVWRSRPDRPPPHEEWYVLAADQSEGLRLREAVDWSPGEPYYMPADLCQTLLARRLRTAIEKYAETGRTETRQEAHYGLGAEMRPDGTVAIRAAGEE